jgi:hypothetical protein
VELVGGTGAWCEWRRRLGGLKRLAGRSRCSGGPDQYAWAEVAVHRMNVLHVTWHRLEKE